MDSDFVLFSNLSIPAPNCSDDRYNRTHPPALNPSTGLNVAL